MTLKQFHEDVNRGLDACGCWIDFGIEVLLIALAFPLIILLWCAGVVSRKRGEKKADASKDTAI